MFKFIVLIFCVVSNHVFADELPDDIKQMIKNLHDACVTETGATEALISGANNGKFGGEEPLKCYMKCLMTSVGILDDDGALDAEAFLDLLPESMRDHGEKVVEACKPEGANACDIAYNLNVCSYNINPSKYMLY